jgi:preprotein translocase subunit SecA
MKFRLEDMVQRPFHYAIVDEVDSILIDEARTPLIISGPTEDNSELYNRIDKLIPPLDEEDFEKDEKQRTVTLTEAGVEKIEAMLRDSGMMTTGTLYDIHNVSLVHHVNQALRAHKLFARDTDYIVKDDKIIIIDEFTGRMMEGRRYSEGLHQALEAKENVTVQNENQTLASITFQNYFRLYPKLSGMTGTAMTEAEEFGDIYKLEVIEIPTNEEVRRTDNDDEVYRTTREKFDAIVEQVIDCRTRQQPLLIGTVSIEKSEALSEVFKKHEIPHNVLNARYHEQEAYIIAQAGVPGTVTIATNMAGRGTDIQLGGNLDMRLKAELPQIEDPAEREQRGAAIRAEIAAAREIVVAGGGLFVVGSERHESRRIDNQLRGRSGRQGDPGASKFFVSLDDDLMRIFGSERMDSVLSRLGLKDGEAVIHPWVNKALAKAQQKVEARNYDIRKQLLKYDDVMNDQRKVVYEQRKEIMSADDVAAEIADMRYETIAAAVALAIPENALPEQWDTQGLHAECLRLLGLDLPVEEWAKEDGVTGNEIEERIIAAADRRMAEKSANFGTDMMRMAEKSLLLQLLDQTWKDHLLSLDHLRQGINLRAYAQRDPLNEYKREAFELFEGMLVHLRDQVTSVLSHIELRYEPPPPVAEPYASGAGPQPMGGSPPAEMLVGGPPPRSGGGGQFAEAPREREPAMADAGRPMLGSGYPHLAPAPPPQSITRPAPRRAAGNGAADGPMPRGGGQPAGPRSPWAGTPRNAACPCGSGKKFKHCHGRI